MVLGGLFGGSQGHSPRLHLPHRASQTFHTPPSKQPTFIQIETNIIDEIGEIVVNRLLPINNQPINTWMVVGSNMVF